MRPLDAPRPLFTLAHHIAVLALAVGCYTPPGGRAVANGAGAPVAPVSPSTNELRAIAAMTSPATASAAPSASAASASRGAGGSEMQSASTAVSTRDGKVTIRGRDHTAYHSHRGPPARLDDASFVVRNADGRRHRLTVTSIDFLVGRSCAEPPTEVKAHPTFGELEAENTGAPAGTKSFAMPAQAELGVSVSFGPPVEAYYTHCDRFAFRVHFDVDGEGVVAIAETLVSREEDLPDP